MVSSTNGLAIRDLVLVPPKLLIFRRASFLKGAKNHILRSFYNFVKFQNWHSQKSRNKGKGWKYMAGQSWTYMVWDKNWRRMPGQKLKIQAETRYGITTRCGLRRRTHHVVKGGWRPPVNMWSPLVFSAFAQPCFFSFWPNPCIFSFCPAICLNPYIHSVWTERTNLKRN